MCVCARALLVVISSASHQRTPPPYRDHQLHPSYLTAGLTLQRAIRALESYGHHAESVLLGLALTDALLRAPGCAANASACGFPQQIDPFSGVPEPGDGYGLRGSAPCTAVSPSTSFVAV